MKVDVTKIDGYEAMTDAEKLDAVLNYEMEVPQAEPIKDDEETLKLKEAFNKASSEVAEYKRQLRAKETAEETAKREAAESQQKLLDELNQLRRERTASTYTAKYMEIGYDAETARALADTLPDGLGEDFFTRQKSFLEDTIQKAKAQVLNQQPQPTAGSPLSGKSAEDLEREKIRKWAGLK